MQIQLPFNSRLNRIFDIDILVPVEAEVKQHYQQQQLHGNNIAFPYWSRLWASSIALSQFILNHPDYVSGKRILELGAGLALPSFIASRFAETVMCTDKDLQAVQLMNQNIEQLRLQNVIADVVDWTKLDLPVTWDVLFLSDVNYEPSTFQHLHLLLTNFLIQPERFAILATPQRLAGKEFIAALHQFIAYSEEQKIFVEGITNNISLFVLNSSTIQ